MFTFRIKKLTNLKNVRLYVSLLFDTVVEKNNLYEQTNKCSCLNERNKSKKDRETVYKVRVVDPHSLDSMELNEHEAGKDLRPRRLTISSSS